MRERQREFKKKRQKVSVKVRRRTNQTKQRIMNVPGTRL